MIDYYNLVIMADLNARNAEIENRCFICFESYDKEPRFSFRCCSGHAHYSCLKTCNVIYCPICFKHMNNESDWKAYLIVLSIFIYHFAGMYLVSALTCFTNVCYIDINNTLLLFSAISYVSAICIMVGVYYSLGVLE